jgi:hypothetical protein
MSREHVLRRQPFVTRPAQEGEFMMRASLFAAFVVMMVMQGLVRPASATPISYQESVSGDLPDSLPAPPAAVFTLDVGANTLSGTSHFSVSSNGAFDFDLDSFAFIVPVGMKVTNISYAFTRGGNANAGRVDYELVLGNALVTDLGDDSVDLFAPSPKSMFGGAFPVSAGTYGLQNSLLQEDPVGAGWTDNYTWSLTVARTDAPVPEPASLVLLGSGLLGAGVRRWRARRTAV